MNPVPGSAPPTPVQRMLYLAGAFVCFSLGMALIAFAGLPDQNIVSSSLILSDVPMLGRGLPAPVFSGELLSGERLTLASLRGSPVILNFWATWCTPCEVEMPELQSLVDNHAQAGLRVIGVNLGETRPAVAEWVERLELRFPIVLDSDGSIAALYRIVGQPTTYVIDDQGFVRDVIYGPATSSQLESMLAAFWNTG